MIYLYFSRQYNPNGTRDRYPDGRPRLGSNMGGAGGGSSKDFGGSGVNGGSPTSFDIPATELEAARPQVNIALIHFITAWNSKNSALRI